MIRLLATGLLFCAPLSATILSSADPTIAVSTGTVTRVQPVSCDKQVYCWGDVNAPWISNQDSGWNGTQLAEPVGSFAFYEHFSATTASIGTLTLGADDHAGAYLIDDLTLAVNYLGESSFFFPQTFSFAISPGAKTLLVDLSSDFPSAPGNYSGAAWYGTISPVPEPSMWPVIAVFSLIVLCLLGIRGKR